MDLKPVRGRLLKRTDSLARGLIGCWPINDGSGKKIFDHCKPGLNGNVGVLTGGASWRHGAAIYMDGVDGHIALSWSKLGLAGLPLTISMIGRHKLGQQTNYVSFSDDGEAADYIQIGVHSTNVVRAIQRGNGTQRAALSVGTLADNERFVATGVFKSTTDRWIYLNTEPGVQNTNDCGAHTWANIDTFTIGVAKINVDVYYESQGFECCMIWNRALLGPEVRRLHEKDYRIW